MCDWTRDRSEKLSTSFANEQRRKVTYFFEAAIVSDLFYKSCKPLLTLSYDDDDVVGGRREYGGCITVKSIVDMTKKLRKMFSLRKKNSFVAGVRYVTMINVFQLGSKAFFCLVAFKLLFDKKNIRTSYNHNSTAKRWLPCSPMNGTGVSSDRRL